MKTLAFSALLLVFSLNSQAGEVVITVSDFEGAGQRMATPVALPMDLAQLLGTQVLPRRLQLMELNRVETRTVEAIPAQFEAEAHQSLRGTLWWLLPPGTARQRRFRLSVAADDAPPSVTVKVGDFKASYDMVEGALPILRYNHGTVPVPAGIATNYARGDYLMPLFGPAGEVLTDDYPKDHPHHRGISWSWPVTRWGNDVRDIWAVSGVWARPVALRRIESGPVFALLHAENVWKWGDTNPIVREEVVLRAFHRSGSNRLVDVEVRLTALADRVAIGGRPHAGYGGFGLRAMPAQQRVITRHTDPPAAKTRRSWLDYSGVFAGGQGPAGVAIFEHVDNLYYPNTLLEYPELNYVMPAFPGEREVSLSKERPLVLRHRLWIHAGMAGEQQLADIWTAYAHPPQAKLTTFVEGKQADRSRRQGERTR